MARIGLVREADAAGEVKEIYEDIKDTMGWKFVPETFQLMAHNPEHLEAYWTHYKSVMEPGLVDIRTKKLIAFVVSALNNCQA